MCWQLSRRLFIASLAGSLGLFAERDGVLSMPLPPLGPPWQQAAALEACVALLERANDGAASASCASSAPSSSPVCTSTATAGCGAATPSRSAESPDFFYRRSEMVEPAAPATSPSATTSTNCCAPTPAPAPSRCASVPRPRACSGACGSAAATTTTTTPATRRPSPRRCHAALRRPRPDGIRLYMIGDTLAGITSASACPPASSTSCSRRLDLDVPGASQFIFREFCRGLDDDAL